jgi:transcriptional regulator with XRE-family HTH domain
VATIGQMIRERRTRAFSLTLQDLASACGVSKPYLSLVERDQVPAPSDGKLARLELALDLPAGALTRRAAVTRTPAIVLALIPAATLERFVNGEDAQP